MNELVKRDGIAGKIYLIRGVQVMLDSDLSEIYEVDTKVFNQTVKRNIKRFPEAFRYQLTKEEYANLVSEMVPSSLRSHSVTLETNRRGQHRKYLPYVFTEQGVAMLSPDGNLPRLIDRGRHSSMRIAQLFSREKVLS